MSGRPQNCAADRARIGQAVLQARSAGVDWKVLERTFDRDRSQLYRYAISFVSGGDSGEMQQNSLEMQHLGARRESSDPQSL